MAIASSGALSISDLSSEFGGSGARSLSDYYAGAGLVASLLTDTSGNAVPSSGTIKFSDFYTCVKFVAGSFTTLTSSTTATVPTGANAMHIEFAVGGGGGGNVGDSYDRAGGESAGAGGGSGAYISDKVFTVVAGETITFTVGAAGAGLSVSTLTSTAQSQGQFVADLNKSGSTGGTTSCSGSSTGTIFTLTGGTGGSSSNGGVQGPLRTNAAGSGGSVSHIDTGLTGTFTNASNVGANMTTLTSGPTGSFNDSGGGTAGGAGGNCSGDGCRIDGSAGGGSYNGNVSGGTGGSGSGSGTVGGAGTRGSGGGGSGGEIPVVGTRDSGAGGAGEIKFRFIRRNA